MLNLILLYLNIFFSQLIRFRVIHFKEKIHFMTILVGDIFIYKRVSKRIGRIETSTLDLSLLEYIDCYPIGIPIRKNEVLITHFLVSWTHFMSV